MKKLFKELLEVSSNKFTIKNKGDKNGKDRG
jgi:hypothetical protein